MPAQFSGVVTEQKGPPAPGIPPRLSQEARSRLSPNPLPVSQATYQPQSHGGPPQHSYQPSQMEGGPPQHSYQPQPQAQAGSARNGSGSLGPPQHSYQAGPPQHAYQQPVPQSGPPQHSYQQPVAQSGPPQHSYQQPQAAAAPPQHAYQPTYNADAVTKTNAAARSGTRAGGGTRGVIPESPSRFGYWASNMAIGSAWSAGFLGACAIGWGITNTGYQSSMLELMSGIYGIVLGIAILAYEKYVGIDRSNHWFPARAIVYAALSVFCFYSEAMMIAGIFLACTAIVQLCATFLREEYKGSAEKPAAKKEAIVLEAQPSLKVALFAYITMLRQQNKLGVLVFVCAYLAANIAIFAYNVDYYTNLVNAQRANNPGQYLSGWVPYAKGFGNLLDFNCAFILVPVCRTFLRILYNRSTADQGFFARLLRGILYFIPIDKNIVFHKLIAKFVLMASFGHTVCHFFNYAAAPSLTYSTFGLSPWITGGLICLCLLLIFSSAGESVRRGQFEIFWYNHHLFILFFALILGHGRGGQNPHFHWWFIGPGALYVIERLLRVYRAHKKVVILSVTMMDDVFSLEFSKEGVFATPFKEGQYIFLNCNAVSMVQWHPFTISSAPQERTVTVHIRVMGPGSWTRGVRDYIGNMGPTSKSFFTFERMEPGGKLQGKICGPDGKRMLAIDGPHSAPTQHIGEYSHVIVIGAGIGVTPVAATLKSVIFHRWKYFVGQCFPDHAYFVWVCGHKDIDAFRWLIRYIKDAQDEVTHMSITNPSNMASKTFEFHIFITSVPKDQKPIEVVIDDEIGFWGVPREENGPNGIREVEKHRCNWDEADLYRLMMCPPPHTQLNNIHIWEGRPKWDPLFQHVGDRHANVDIGVTFCGNPMIGRDLYRQCYTHSRGRKQGIFKFHKENF